MGSKKGFYNFSEVKIAPAQKRHLSAADSIPELSRHTRRALAS